MKLFIKVLIIAIVFVIAWDYAKNRNQEGPLLSLSNKSGSISVNIREPEKDQLKSITKRIGDLVYHEATIHNPPGDMVPDQIDDNVIKETKKIVN